MYLSVFSSRYSQVMLFSYMSVNYFYSSIMCVMSFELKVKRTLYNGWYNIKENENQARSEAEVN